MCIKRPASVFRHICACVKDSPKRITMNQKKTRCNGTTHSACVNRLEAEGGEALCCWCRPHDNCLFDLAVSCHQPEEGWEQRHHDFFWEHGKYEGRKLGYQEHKRFFAQELANARREGEKSGLKFTLKAWPKGNVKIYYLPLGEKGTHKVISKIQNRLKDLDH